MKAKRIYLDHASATPMDPEVLKVFVATARKYIANPHALHKEGQAAEATLRQARTTIAELLGAHADEIVFTGSATEANNMTIKGVIRAAQARGVRNPRIIVSAIEHASVLESAYALLGEGVFVDKLPVDHRGSVDPRALRKLITAETVLVSVMYANNEIGAIAPIRDIAREVRHARSAHGSCYPYFHTDAAQAMNYLDGNVSRLGVDLMTVSSGKTYGPYGIAALFVRRGVDLEPLLHGGRHEGGRRAGTEAVPLASAFARALAIAEKMKRKEAVRVKSLRDTLAREVLRRIPDMVVNGGGDLALPNILSVSVSGVESEALVIYLDAAGIAVSGKSACTTSLDDPSHVILALGREEAVRGGVIRFSLGRQTTRRDILYTAKEFSRIVSFLRGVQG